MQICYRYANNFDKINWSRLSRNPNAISILEKHLDKIDWSELSSNPNAIHLLKDNLDKINWAELSSNPNAISILEANIDKIDWNKLIYNKNAMHILEQNIEILAELAGDYDSDDSDNANDFNILEWLSAQPHAVPLLERNPDYIHWGGLSSNKAAIHILEQNIDNIDWGSILQNENAIELIRNYDGDRSLDYLYVLSETHNTFTYDGSIDYLYILSKTHNAFTYDYEQMKIIKYKLHKDLVEYLYHPIRIQKYLDTGMELEEYLP